MGLSWWDFFEDFFAAWLSTALANLEEFGKIVEHWIHLERLLKVSSVGIKSCHYGDRESVLLSEARLEERDTLECN